MDKAAIAKQICEELGIEWDKHLNVPYFKDAPVSKGMVQATFGIKTITYQTTEAVFLKCDSTATRKYNANGAIALAA